MAEVNRSSNGTGVLWGTQGQPKANASNNSVKQYIPITTTPISNEQMAKINEILRQQLGPQFKIIEMPQQETDGSTKEAILKALLEKIPQDTKPLDKTEEPISDEDTKDKNPQNNDSINSTEGFTQTNMDGPAKEALIKDLLKKIPQGSTPLDKTEETISDEVQIDKTQHNDRIEDFEQTKTGGPTKEEMIKAFEEALEKKFPKSALKSDEPPVNTPKVEEFNFDFKPQEPRSSEEPFIPNPFEMIREIPVK